MKKKPAKRSLFKPWTWFKKTAVIPVVKLSGVIGMSTPLKPGLKVSAVAEVLEKAFTTGGAKAVAISVNSPGGSPVQSMLIYQRIRALAEEHELPVYMFAEDVAASGGYMIAVAGDEIYADPSSIIGSIGVISAGFGFHKLIENYGVERRVYTAGNSKMSLDPFQPQKQEEIEHLKEIQRDVHKTFIDLVKGSRGDKITAQDDDVFNGSFWSGNQAKELGLIDDLADMRSKMRERYGENVRLKLISANKGLFSKIGLGSSARSLNLDLGQLSQNGLANEVISAIEERAIWSRFGF